MISESVIVGTLLYGKEQLTHIALSSVKGYHFSGTYTRIIFEACRKCEEQFGNITEDAVLQEADGEFDKDYLKDYRQYRADSLKEIEGHCEKLIDSYTRKRIIDGLDGIIINSDEYDNSRQIISDTESVISSTSMEVGMPGLTYTEIKERDANKPRYEKLHLGDPFLDETFFRACGCHKGHLTTLFGESGHGKSTAACMFARMLISSGYKGLYASFEDVDSKYADRVYDGLDNKDVIDNLIITDVSQGCVTLDDTVTTAKYHKSKNDISFVIVDNAQIVTVDGIRTSDEKERLVTISDRMRQLAIELDVWVLLLCQISNERSKKSGYDRQPKLGDIYGSGQIRKDSFMAISIFKPSEIDSLLVKNEHNGEIRGVKHPNNENDIWPLSRVLLKQEKVRDGEKYYKSVRFNLTDKGLFRPTDDQGAPF